MISDGNSLPSHLKKVMHGRDIDIAYYFLSGLAMHGNNFIMHPEIHYPELLQTDYDFRRNSIGDGFENQKLFLVQYTKNYDVVLEDEKQPLQ